MLSFIISSLLLLIPFAQSDRIIINNPEKGSSFRPGSTMSIDYTVRFEGMAKLGSTSVSLHYPNYTIVTFLPAASWIDTPTGRRGASTSWTIPVELDSGKYIIRVSGPSTYLCSIYGNGQAPYDRCNMYLHRSRFFTVDWNGEDGSYPNDEGIDAYEEYQ